MEPNGNYRVPSLTGFRLPASCPPPPRERAHTATLRSDRTDAQVLDGPEMRIEAVCPGAAARGSEAVKGLVRLKEHDWKFGGKVADFPGEARRSGAAVLRGGLACDREAAGQDGSDRGGLHRGKASCSRRVFRLQRGLLLSDPPGPFHTRSARTSAGRRAAGRSAAALRVSGRAEGGVSVPIRIGIVTIKRCRISEGGGEHDCSQTDEAL
ncbi:hypothetical protein AOLI_G00141510 [Acnodon oligacanthus]